MKKKQIIIFFVLSIIFISTILLIHYHNSHLTNDSNTFSISYTDTFGFESIIKSVPQKIISLSPNTTEIICSLELENKLIGKTDYCDYPPSISSVTSIGTITNPNLEIIANLNPDLIITDGMQSKEIINSIRNLGYTVIVLRSNETLQGTYDIISDIGLVTNSSEKAEQLISHMKQEFSKIENAISKIKHKKRVYYSISLSEYGLYTAGANTYINQLLELAGLVNIATDLTGWTYSVENLIKNNPDYIICSHLYNSKYTLLNYSPISDLTAVKNQFIIEIDNNLIERQGPRNIDGIKILLKEIYNINI